MVVLDESSDRLWLLDALANCEWRHYFHNAPVPELTIELRRRGMRLLLYVTGSHVYLDTYQGVSFCRIPSSVAWRLSLLAPQATER